MCAFLLISALMFCNYVISLELYRLIRIVMSTISLTLLIDNLEENNSSDLVRSHVNIAIADIGAKDIKK